MTSCLTKHRNIFISSLHKLWILGLLVSVENRTSVFRLQNRCIPTLSWWHMSCYVNLHVTYLVAYGKYLRLFDVYFWDVIRESRTWGWNVVACTDMQWSLTSLSLYGKGCDEVGMPCKWIPHAYKLMFTCFGHNLIVRRQDRITRWRL
jgi:hypothetical protein